jgi:pimeloyl-ACP methyl ester carboxylesterase
MAEQMRDMIVLLPGIMGSVLQHNGVDLWAISGRSVFSFVKSFGNVLEKLVLHGDDSSLDDLGDGIKATALMPDRHIVPGLLKVEGYSRISRTIRENFAVTVGDNDPQKPANYFEFPYDWRRDNRVAARQLKRLIDARLPIWRQHRQDENAKVILLAHSMGGLVARHYLEVLDGWPDCRMVVTFGTPYRGSVKALQYLANGYKNLLVDLTEAVRSFTSIYQLLPIYPVVHTSSGYKHVTDLDDIAHVDKVRAEAARKFHLDIVAKVSEHQNEQEYTKNFQTVPVVGISQPTLQSGELTSATGVLEAVEMLPNSGLPDKGDGTVPYTSAIPFEFSGQFREHTFIEQHGSLQNNDRILEYLMNLLKRAGTSGALIEALGPGQETTGISLALEDLYLAGEPVELHAGIVNPIVYPDALQARIEPADSGAPVITTQFKFDGTKWVAVLENLPSGLYRVEVVADAVGDDSIKPVHGLFEVLSGN